MDGSHKRGAEQHGQEGSEAKRARTEGAAHASAAPAKPALNLEALQKAKALLEKQKQLREKLKKLPQVAGAPGAGLGPAAAAPTAASLAATAPPLAPGGMDAAAAARFGAQAALPSAMAMTAAAAAAAAAATATMAAAAAAPRPALAPGAAAVAAAVRPVRPAGGLGALTAGPRPLRLDALGREVDESGNVIQPVARQPTSLINQRVPDAAPAAPPSSPPPAGPREDDFFDASMAARPANRALPGPRRRRGALDFVAEGSFARQAEIHRLKMKYGEADFKKHLPAHLRRPPRGPAGPAEAPGAAAAAAGGALLDANLTPLGVREPEVSEEDRLRSRLPGMTGQLPEVEWWDRPLLEGGAYYATQQEQQHGADGDQPAGSAIAEAPDGSGAVMRLRLSKITHYVEHPVPLDPPAAAPPPPPQPLKLTKRELKKMRTQRRQAREKEKQELIRQGLLEPPKPKVKISNLMRVLGEQAALDPTAIEQEVRRQMAERQSAHEDRNLARKLTPAERRDKKLRKMFDSTVEGTEVVQAAVYRVEDLGGGQHRFKVDVNAKENHMSGVMLLVPGSFSVVVVEGCPKALKRYHKLMLRRIDWNAQPLPPTGADPDNAAGDEHGDDGEGKPPNSCHLVWQGVVAEAAFKEFARAEAPAAEDARKLLEQHGVAHYWDAAANFDFEAAPIVELP